MLVLSTARVVERLPYDLAWRLDAPLACHVHRTNPVVRAGRYLQGRGHATNRTRSDVGIPFAGMLASMALSRIVTRFWHRRMGSFACAWSAALLMSRRWQIGVVAAGAAWHALLVEYPAVRLTAAGALRRRWQGVLLRGGFAGAPAGNTAMLALGMAMGVVIGATGASMVLDPPSCSRQCAPPAQGASRSVFLIVLVSQCVRCTYAAPRQPAASRAAARRAVLLACPASAGAAADGDRRAV